MNNFSIHALLEKKYDLPKSEIEYLLMHVLQQSKAYLYTHPKYDLTHDEQKKFQHALTQRLKNIPLAYITNQKNFWQQTLMVNKHTLIPRPETESLVEWALALLPDTAISIADLGTGSGAIAIALASERPQWHITATDNYSETLFIAENNAKQSHCNNIIFSEGNWCDALPKNQLFSAIISNPPYIAEHDPHLHDLRFEPQHALTSGPDGLNALHNIIENAYDYLLPNGLLMLEHGYDQRDALVMQLEKRGYHNIAYRDDYNGVPRVIVGYR